MKIDLPDPRFMVAEGSPTTSVKANHQALESVASDFEALFFQQMLKGMRQAGDVLVEDNPFNSKEQSFMRDWHDAELARSLAKGGGIGLAEQLVHQVEALL